MNDIKKIKFLISLIIANVALLFQACEEPKLKQPGQSKSEQTEEKSNISDQVDREFTRELAREFAREFVKEFAKQINHNALTFDANESLDKNNKKDIKTGLVDARGKPHSLLSHCSEDVLEFYLNNADCFSILSPRQIPDDLNWQDGSNEKEFSSPEAKRGGTFHAYMSDFPRTLRTIGPDANGGFRSYLLDNNVISLTHAHPNSDGYYPGVADEWAVGKDGCTVYFRLDPNARFSDGNLVKASDYFFFFYFMRSKHIQAPWYNDFYGKDKFQKVTLYDERTLSITFYKAKPDIVERVSIRPKPEHFYSELGGEYLAKYQWNPEPTTGAYVALPKNVDKGKSVTLVRQNDWWANDKPFFRKRFNPDRIKVSVIRDTDKAFEVFLKGQIDAFGLAKTEYWYEKLADDHPLVKNGYINKVTFFNQAPPPSYALRINSQKAPLDNLDVRVGFHHAMNFGLVLERIFRGDFVRMNTVADGFGDRSHPQLKAREFSVEKAVESFSRAGYSKRGKDGILMNAAGEKLSIEVMTGYKHYEDVLVVLKEEAKKAGLEIKLKVLEPTAAWKMANEKNHQVIFSAFGTFVELFPRFWEPFHSDNAYQEKGNSKYQENGSLKSGLTTRTSTNNFTQTAVRELDQLIDRYREEVDLGRITEMAHRLSEMIHDHAVWVPAWKKPWLRAGHWNWLQFPDDWGPKESTDYQEFQVFWIDSQEKQKTLDAMETGTPVSSKPSVRVYKKYLTK
ncbi:MAG: ABC transporter substrate-binding protein [Opitutae bacterium]|nr:ABC transporter substrate-binding protein [Opitutae bacterium]